MKDKSEFNLVWAKNRAVRFILYSIKKMAKHIENLIRIANTDVDASKSVFICLTKIKGVNYMLSNAVCKVLSLDKNSKLMDLDDSTRKKIEEVLINPLDFKIPVWMINRQNDPESGENKHLITTDLKLTVDEDIKIMKKIKSYKGLRHQKGLPVRGQRTKSNFRKNKGKVSKIKRKK